jgi:uncharacterized RmlC-like cupin family protein
MDEISVIRARERREDTTQTPGMRREEALAPEGMWSGVARTAPGMLSGWHHHGEYQTSIYVLSGALRMEFGPEGSRSEDAGPDDFIFVPPSAVHRESNPTEEEAVLVVTRAGRGPVVVNVDGPDG